MKIGVCGDIHYSPYSSIIRGRGEKYSDRIENCIKSINWVEELFVNLGCDFEVYVGDFFDTESVDSEVVTSLNDISWNNLNKYVTVGNHEMGMNTLAYSSAHLLNLIPNIYVVNEPSILGLTDFCEVAFLPYVLESNRKPLNEYFGTPFMNRKRIVFSHNDIAGMQMGKFISTDGFSIDEIQENCDLFINGHLHNGGKVADKIFNIGILTGQNFSEDAQIYTHSVFVIDTDTLEIESYENPNAFNFYKLDYTEGDKFDLSDLKSNAVVTLKVKQSEADLLRQSINNNHNIVESRIIVVPESLDQSEIDTNIEKLSVDHLSEFYKFIVDKLGTSDIVQQELTEVCK